MMDRYQLINSIIVQVDAMADLRGAEKCRVIIDILGKLAALKEGLAKEDEAHKNTLASLRKQHAAEMAAVRGENTETIGGQTLEISADGQVRQIEET